MSVVFFFLLVKLLSWLWYTLQAYGIYTFLWICTLHWRKEFLNTPHPYVSHLKSFKCMNFGYMPHAAPYMINITSSEAILDLKLYIWLIIIIYILSYFKYYYNNCSYTFAILISLCSYLLDIVKMSLLNSVFFFFPYI